MKTRLIMGVAFANLDLLKIANSIKILLTERKGNYLLTSNERSSPLIKAKKLNIGRSTWGRGKGFIVA